MDDLKGPKQKTLTLSDWWTAFIAINSTDKRWAGALRAALAILIPGSIAMVTGNQDAILLICAGAFTVIYGEGIVYRKRWKVMLTAGALLWLGVMVGALVGSLVFAPGHGHAWLLLTAVYVAVLGAGVVFVQNALRLPPPGGFFIVMVTGGSTMLARTGIDPLEAGFWPLTAIATGLILGMLPALRDPHGPERATVATLERVTKAFQQAKDDEIARHHQAQTALAAAWEALADAGFINAGHNAVSSQHELVERTLNAQRAIVQRNQEGTGADAEAFFESVNLIDPDRTTMPHSRPTARYRIYRSLTADSHAMITAKKVLIAGLVTGVIGIALGLNRPDWGVISALLILQNGPEKVPGTIRGTHRVLGSMLGLVLFSMFYFFGVGGWTMLAALAICQFFAEIMVVKNYALCVIFSTPLALMMGGLTEPLSSLVMSRGFEIGLSVVFAFIVLWFFSNGSKERENKRLQLRAYQSMSTVLGSLLTGTPDEALVQRRDLQYELLSERRSIQSLAMDHPAQAQQQWGKHRAIQHAGYQILDYCALSPNTMMDHGALGTLIESVRRIAPSHDDVK